jgi:hypothetical protein
MFLTNEVSIHAVGSEATADLRDRLTNRSGSAGRLAEAKSANRGTRCGERTN